MKSMINKSITSKEGALYLKANEFEITVKHYVIVNANKQKVSTSDIGISFSVWSFGIVPSIILEPKAHLQVFSGAKDPSLFIFSTFF